MVLASIARGKLIAWFVLVSLGLAACDSQPPPGPSPTQTPPPSATATLSSSLPAQAAPSPTPAPPSCPPAVTPSAPGSLIARSAAGGWTQEPDFVVPYFSVRPASMWAAQLTLVGLAEWDPQGRLVPELAAAVPSLENGGLSADGRTVTWKLKDCLYWSDGARLTSADVKFTWEAILDPANDVLRRDGYDRITSIDTPDDLTVILRFAEPYAAWPALFSQGPHNAGALLPRHALAGRLGLERDPFVRQPTVASGPFIITEWVPGSHFSMRANPNFHRGRPALDHVQIRLVPDPEAALAALQAGNIDWYPEFSEADIATVGLLEPRIQLAVVPGAEFEHYVFNLGARAGAEGQGQAEVDGFCPLRDARVRRAIVLGIPRQGLVDALLEGLTTVPASQWPNSIWTLAGLEPEPYDPLQAAALLDEAGYSDQDGDGIREGQCDGSVAPLSLRLLTTDHPLRADMAEAVRDSLLLIGVELVPTYLPAEVLFASYADGGPLAAGQYDLAGYTTGYYPDPYTSTWLCEQVPGPDTDRAGSNWRQYCDPALDALFAKAQATFDPLARKAIFDEIQQYFSDRSLVVLLYARAQVYGYADRFLPAASGFFSGFNWNAELWDVK